MVPEPGQLVEVRRHPFVVTDVVRSELELDPLQPNKQRQHVVKLSSVGEDTLGEELEVIWEIEPGARIYENMTLPDPAKGFDSPDRIEAFLNAVRWGAIQSADTRSLQAPFRSGIAIEDYQLDPLVRAIQMPRANLLIADDVGLGKTIEAGLVAQELILRHRVRTILVVCPSSLQIQWRDQMRDKFGLEFRIIDSAAMKDLRRRRGIRVNPWTHFPRLITSIDYLKRERPLALFRECLPGPSEPAYPRRFDLLIIDEAHNVAPSGSGNYATDSQRTTAVRTLARHFEHRLFLTATPHNGYRESFSALLELIDDQRFGRDLPLDQKQLEAIMVRRLKTEIKNPDGTDRFFRRDLRAIEVEWTKHERDAHKKLQRYVELRQQSASEGRERVATEFVLKLLKKRLFSSPAAFARTLEEHEKTLRGLRENKKTEVSLRTLQREFGRLDEDDFDDEEYEETTGSLVEVGTSIFSQLSNEEQKLLRELRDHANQSSARADSKAKELIEWLDQTVRPSGNWNDERVIIFTEYRATQKWLYGLLAARGFAKDARLLTLYGGMPDDDREAIKAAFQANPRDANVRILLATDAASEGIDLQNWCHRAIHYEIPWNPNRLEQRNGRIDRHGQKKQPLIFHFVPKGWERAGQDAGKRGEALEDDLEFLFRAVEKVENIRLDLGKVGSVIADQVQEAMLGKRSRLDTANAEKKAESVRRIYTFQRNVQEQITRLRQRLDDSKEELNIRPDRIEAVVRTALELAGQPDLVEASAERIWPDPTGKRKTSPVFALPKLRGTWARCAEGLEHPHTGNIRLITFDHEIAADRDDLVLVHLNHRLVQMAQRLLRAEIWGGHEHKLSRTSAVMAKAPTLDSLSVVVWVRLVILGTGHQALHEEIVTVGAKLRDGKALRLNVGETKALLGLRSPEEATIDQRGEITRAWPKVESAIVAAIEARIEDRSTSLEKILHEKGEKEAKDLEMVLQELASLIRDELAAEPPPQFELWPQEEKDQRDWNRDQLEERLKTIPAEIARETEHIRERYRHLDAKAFPVGLTFIVPRPRAH